MSLYALSLDPLRAYNKEDIILQLPGEWTIFEIDWFSIFDVESKESYGSVIIPDGLNVPPSLIKVVVCIIKNTMGLKYFGLGKITKIQSLTL
jgi:hypothetical protein